MSFVKAAQRTANTLSRTYSTRLPQKPPPKVVDPLVNNPHASYVQLPDNLTFIHRPPPSLPTPESLTTAPASPLLRAASSSATATSWSDPSLPPVSRPALVNKSGPFERLSDEAIEEMKVLRASNGAEWTRSKLAAKFGCSQSFVSLVAGLKKSEWKKTIREQNTEHESVRARWGERKTMVRKVRVRRREFW